MSSYGGIVQSAYTSTKWMKPGWLSVNELIDALSKKILIIPNPAHNKSSVVIETKKTEIVSVQLYDLTHKKVKDIFSGTIQGKQSIAFQTSGLRNGIYFVRVTIQGVQIHKKLIIY
jgi:hypothetical protein